jgi:hypothetical protein
MGRLDRRWKTATDDVQMVAVNWDSQELPTLAARVRGGPHSVRGGYVRGIQQFGPPLSRARP